MSEKLLTSKEIADALRRSVKFVYCMRARGFPMPGGTASLTEARSWLTSNPKPMRRKNKTTSVSVR